ncbi:MAG: saccharopine dehydrogenase NADP-binding domain-containing protein [Candidatus Jordarchaeales archaeon]
MKACVLGCGTVGGTVAMILGGSELFDEIVLGDIRVEAAKRIVPFCKCKTEAKRVDVNNKNSLKKFMRGADVILNCTGPFYEYGPKVLRAAIEAGVNYVDVCDDLDATLEQLKMDEDAKKAGVTALIGMGSSPGLANVIAKYCAENLLDETEAIDILHVHGGEASEGAAVIKHRIHSMMMDIPMFLDGKMVTVRLFEESGRALETDVEFPEIGTYRVHAYPHPETITLPKYIKGVKRVTNLGTVAPPKYINLIKDVVRLGMTSEEPIEVQGRKVVPLEFAVAFILSQREKILKEAGMTQAMGCLKIDVKGKKKGEEVTYSFSFTSKGAGMGEGTGIPAAIGTILMAQGKVHGKGVLPPEACLDPMDVLKLAQEILKRMGAKGIPLIVEITDKKGKRRVKLEEVIPGLA